MSGIEIVGDELGAIRWWLTHPNELQKRYTSGMPPTSPQALNDLIAIGVDIAEIKRHTAAAKTDGSQMVRLQYFNVPWMGEDGFTETKFEVEGLPSLAPESWDQVDGTIPRDPEDDTSRFRAGPKWSRNSCALDTFMAIVLLANGGRCCADQVDTDFLQKMVPLAEVVRVFQKPWSRLSTEDIMALRDVLRDALQTADPNEFKKGEYWSLYNVFDNLGPAFPQFTATWGAAFRCCPDGEWCVGNDIDGRPLRRLRVGLDHEGIARSSRKTEGMSVQQAISEITGIGGARLRKSDAISRCGGKRCTDESAEGMPFIFDRPPPMLILMRGFEMERKLREGALESHDVDFFCKEDGENIRVLTATYEPWAVATHNGAHFALYGTRVVNGVKDFIVYDGLKRDGAFQVVESLQEVLSAKVGNSALVYKVVSRRVKH